MTAATRSIGSARRNAFAVEQGTVRAVEGSAVTVSWRLDRSANAIVAVHGDYAPAVGDQVVVAPGAQGELYILGVVSAPRGAAASVMTRDGCRAEIAVDEGHEVLTVRDRSGRLVFEHHSASNKSVVHAPEGDLEFRADRGRIDFVAKDTVRVRSERAVEIESDHTVRLSTRAAEARPPSVIALDARGVSVATAQIDARAARAEFAVGEGRLVAHHITTAVETAQHVVGVLETQATRIVERARNVYREATELSQTRAGRMRLVAEATMHILGRRTLLKAEEDMKLKGDKIYLA